MICWHLLSPAKITVGVLSLLFFPVVFLLGYLLDASCVSLLEWEIFSLSGVSFYCPILLDKMSLTFSSVVVLISLSVMLFSISYMSGDPSLEYFIYMVVLFVFSMNLLIYIPHLLVLLLGWDGLGLTSYVLVIYYQNDSSLAAGMVTALSNRVGDSLLILAGSWSLISGHWSFVVSSFQFVWMVGLSIMVCAMTKSAQIPFSAWLPAAMAAPTPVSSLVHSSTLVTAGVYLLIRFYASLNMFYYFCFFIFFSGVVTCFMASLAAIYEYDLKKIIALSTLSQLGVMMMALGLGFPMLAFFHLVTHALFKALLFICAGTIIHSGYNSQDIRFMGDLWSVMPSTCSAFNVANFALCGFPFMAGFYSKDLIVESFLCSFMPLLTGLVMVLSVCLTSAYSVRLSFYTLWSPFKGFSFVACSDESVFVYFSCIFLLVGGVSGGACFSWLLCPFVGGFFLPFFMKIFVLVLVFVFGFVSYVLVSFGFLLGFHRFVGSMWFLVFLTSSPLVVFSSYLGSLFCDQELTWMELLSGKGVSSFFVCVSLFVQRVQGLGVSYLFSFFVGLFFLFLFLL